MDIGQHPYFGVSISFEHGFQSVSEVTYKGSCLTLLCFGAKLEFYNIFLIIEVMDVKYPDAVSGTW